LQPAASTCILMMNKEPTVPSVIPRRAALAATPPLLAATDATAQPPQARGPLIWRDMDQAALDAAYDQGVYAPNRDQVLGRYASNSALARAAMGAPRREAYGSAAIEQLDIHRTSAASPAPVLIFIHGGAWRGGLARDYAFAAECVLRAGAHLVVPDFSAVQDRGGDLLPIAQQIRQAVAWVARNAAGFGGDASRIFIAGHSSGAHMAAVALTTDWSGWGLPADVLKGGLLVSGLYDLRGARLSARSRYVNFTDAMEDALSPQRHIGRLNAPVTVLYGSLETPEFQRMARDFAAEVAAAGKPVQALRGEGYNHFEIIETMANPYGLVGRAGLAMMGL
jgi:arylformamidase